MGLMKKLLFCTIFIVPFFLIGCDNKSESDNKSEINRYSKSTIKLLCGINKLHVIKEYDGTIADRWFDENEVKEMGHVPIIIETNKGSDEMWINGTGKIAIYHDDNGLGYLKIRQEKIDLITLHFISVNYKDFQFITESSMIIKDDDSAKYYNFQNKPEISSKGYGICEKLKWEVK